MSNEAPVGSHWYVWGEHYMIQGETTVDGEPAVILKRTGGWRADRPKRPKPKPVITRLFLRRAVLQKGE